MNRLDMQRYNGTREDETTQCVQLYLPDIGNVTITYETSTWSTDNPQQLVLSIDFPIEDLRVIDRNGNDRRIS